MSEGAVDLKLAFVGIDAARNTIFEWIESEPDAEMREAIAPELWALVESALKGGETTGFDHDQWMQMCEGASMAIDAWVRTGEIPQWEVIYE